MIKKVKNTKPHEYQDNRYGKNIRAVTPVKKKDPKEPQRYRDTVTGNIAEIDHG